MKTLQKVVLVSFFYVLLVGPNTLTASELVHNFSNPSFSGTGYSSHVLSIEQLQHNRKNEVKELIKELTKFELSPSYEPVKQLYKEFKKYIDTGERAIIDIPCPNMIFRGVCVNMRMKGVLANTVNEKVMMKMEKLKM